MNQGGDFNDLLRLRPADMPREWAAHDDETFETLIEKRDRRLPTSLISTSEANYLMELQADRWFLLKNIYRFRAASTGRIEDYYTVEGTTIPKPFNGLDQIFAFLRDQFVTGLGLPGFESDEQIALGMLEECITLGYAEPISVPYAYTLCTKIRLKTGRDPRMVAVKRLQERGAFRDVAPSRPVRYSAA